MYVLGLEGVEVFKIEKSLIQNFASALGAVEISTLDGDTQSVCFEESAPPIRRLRDSVSHPLHLIASLLHTV